MDSKLEHTERQLQEALAALKHARELYAMADSAGDGHTDWLVEEDRFYGSPRFLQVCGLPPDTVFGGRMGFVSRFPFHPDDREQTVKQMTAHFASNAVRLEADMRMLVHGEVRWIHMSGVCTRDEQGKLLRWTGTITDITDRKRTEMALKQSEERFALAAAAASDGIWDWDLSRNTMFLSERALFLIGLKAGSSTLSRDVWERDLKLQDDDAETLRRHEAECLECDSSGYDLELRVVTADESWRWVRLRALCVRDADGHPTRIGGSISDIDTQKRAESALRQRQKLEAIGTLAGGIAHDFNNILAAIVGYGEMASKHSRSGSKAHSHLQQVLIAGNRGRTLVERILAFSRTGTVAPSAINLAAVVAESLALMRATLPPRIVLVQDLGHAPLATLADPGQVHQVVSNLVTNAVQAISGTGEVRVSARSMNAPRPLVLTTGVLPEGDYIALEVADTGCGITKEHLGRIFDPFFTTKEVGVGTGLGLSLVHGIAAELNGAVDVATQAGEGSRFLVYLPLEQRLPDEAELVPEELPRGQGEHVLVVDDEPALLSLTCEHLIELGYFPEPHHSGQRALEAFRLAPERFNLLMTDVRMPGMSGVELVQAVRGLSPELPAIFTSGFFGASLSELGFDNAALLQKPVSTQALAVGLARALNR